jgi:hypothetical protein
MPLAKPAAALFAAMVLVSPCPAEEAPARPDGYSFGKPRLLTQQLIFGLAHGMGLLAAACREEANGATIAEAHERWLNRYRPRIDEARREVSRHYFDGNEASPEAIGDALHLKSQLGERSAELAAACASFTDAIASSRYDLDLFYTLRQDAARVERADAVRSRVARCLKKLTGEPAARLEERFSRWSSANERLEGVARSRVFMQRGDNADDRLWRLDAGAGAAPAMVECERLADAIDGPDHSLATVFEDAGR